MFKKIILLSIVLFSFCFTNIFAQIDLTKLEQREELSEEIAHKIKEVYMTNKHKIPNEKALKNMSFNIKLPKNMNEILHQYDWLEVADYSFTTAETPKYQLNEINYDFVRHDTKKGVFNFRYRLLLQGTKPELMFMENDSKIPKTIAKKGTHFYYMDTAPTYEGISYYPVLDYKNGFLIIDISQSGAYNDLAHPFRFRKVYMAIPKFF